ncbi:MAG: septum formation initiator family protein [Vicingaceae bacterium]
MLEKIPPYLKNKYSLTGIVFVVWMTFFDQNNLLLQFQNKLELWDLDSEKEYYQLEITKTKSDLKELTTDMKSLERFAREKYLMKRDNEEVFVIVEE